MAFARSAAAAALRRNVCTQYRQVASIRTFSQPTVRTRPQQLAPKTLASTTIRWHSAPVSQSKVYDFNQIQKLVESPSEDTVLIDVREPSEYAAGYIPSAINIPIKSQADAMFLPGDEFEDRFGFSKPTADQKVVFYCKSGVRSSAAAQLAQQIGYTDVAEYRGSWLDWEKNGGSSSKP